MSAACRGQTLQAHMIENGRRSPPFAGQGSAATGRLIVSETWFTSATMTLVLEDFTPYLAEAFALVGNAAAAPFVLRQATALPDRSDGRLPRPPFVLLFAAADPTVRGQGDYELAHPALGPTDIFLVPVGRDGDGILYEAVFN